MLTVDSDILYVLATGFSIFFILVALVAQRCFGKNDQDEKEEDVREQLTKGDFGRVPIKEWKQHKSALDQEYQERFMSSTNDDEQSPLISRADIDGLSEGVDDTKPPTGKSVHFQDNSTGQEADDQDQDSDSNEQPQRMLDEDLKNILDDSDLSHLPGQLKSVKLRKATKQVEAGLTDEQKEQEAQVRSEQLASILALMREQEAKFGTSSMEDIEEQLKMYSL